MKWFKTIVALILLLLIFWLFNYSHGSLPPLAKFFNPFTGFWQNNEQSDKIEDEIQVTGLEQPVRVVWDNRHVPHIFAKNSHDLYFAQGYITARDRLWQMEFQTHAAAGRISEIIGNKSLAYDRYQRRIGMVYAAENTVRAMEENEEVKAVAAAYKDGVNAFIATLSTATLPLEYKILDYKPEPWTELKTAILLKMMALDLTGSFSEKQMTLTREIFGDSLMKKLFPDFPPMADPIVPPGTAWDFTPQPPQKPEKDYFPSHRYTQGIFNGEMIMGSNNWAVSGSKTASGYPILCNDPHLHLSLPSIWYEVQLNAPGVNVYGVSLLGAPAVIIGFNEKIAWGVTNAGSDVMDMYAIKFKDETHREYYYDGNWEKSRFRIEEIKIRGGKTVYDTVCYTRHGPVVYRTGEKPYSQRIPLDASLRWTAHDPSNEMAAFLRLNRAKDYEDYLKALQFYNCPAQNFAYADAANSIAIWHNGLFPLRWRDQGKYLLDGADPAHSWQGWVPKDQNPHVKNPPRGFVSSANQVPADSSYPYYLGWNYASFERGSRINELLDRMRNIEPQDMVSMQNDVVNLRARTILPALLRFVQAEKLNATEAGCYRELKNWNFENRANFIAPLIFEYWWNRLYRAIWQDDVQSDTGSLRWPRRDVTITMILNEPDNLFFDNRTTPKTETAADISARSFHNAIASLEKKFGEFGESWQWGTARGTDINHLANIPGLGRTALATNGNGGIINATSKTSGPSWRMVVALGPQVKAWGIYPGGQSGNPGSRYYDNMVDDWVKGNIYELSFLKSPDEKNSALIGTTILRGVK